MNAISIVEKFNSNIVNAGYNSHVDRPANDRTEQDNSRREDLSPEEIKRTVHELNRLSGSFNEKVQFGFHEKTNRIIIKIIDKNTNEVVSEIPSKYSLRLLEHFQENMGFIVDESR